MTTETRTLETPDVDLVVEVRPPTTRGCRAPHPAHGGSPHGRPGLRHPGLVLHRPHGRRVRPARHRAQRAQGRLRPAHPRTARGRPARPRHRAGSGPVDVFASSGGRGQRPGPRGGAPRGRRHPGRPRAAAAHPPARTPTAPWPPNGRCRRRTTTGGSGPGWRPSSRSPRGRASSPTPTLAQPTPDPAQFGLPTQDDGGRDDPLLSGTGNAITAPPTRPGVLAGGADPAWSSRSGSSPRRGAHRPGRRRVLAEALGRPVTEFPSHHGGFLGGEHRLRGPAGGLRRPPARGARRRRRVRRPTRAQVQPRSSTPPGTSASGS